MAKLQLGGGEKQYGDQKVLDELKTSTKPLPISGAMVQKRGPGRPAGSTATTPAAAPNGGEAFTPEHRDMMVRLQKAEDVVVFWAERVQMSPDVFTQMYARHAIAVRDQLALKLYKQTPNFLT